MRPDDFASVAHRDGAVYDFLARAPVGMLQEMAAEMLAKRPAAMQLDYFRFEKWRFHPTETWVLGGLIRTTAERGENKSESKGKLRARVHSGVNRVNWFRGVEPRLRIGIPEPYRGHDIGKHKARPLRVSPSY